MLMTTNNAFTEVIENLHFSLDHKMKTATLLPKMNEHYSGDIILPEKVKDNNGVEYSVIALEDSCFENCNGLTSIDIPSSVTSLGDHCFSDWIPWLGSQEKVIRDTCPSNTYYFAKYHVLLCKVS